MFASGDDGGARWCAAASLVETCKLNGVDPQRYFTDLLTRLVNGWPNDRIDELMPWCWATPQEPQPQPKPPRACRRRLRSCRARGPDGASPTAAIVDTQSAKTTESGGPRGAWDAAKRMKGRKRHVAVDTDGLLLGVLAHAADIQDADSLGDLLRRVKPLYNWLRAVFADGVYNRITALLACFLFGLALIIVRSTAGATGFVVQPRRWVVENHSAGSAGGGDCRRTTRRCPKSPRRWSPWPRSASCSTASPIPIAGDYPPHDFANGVLVDRSQPESASSGIRDTGSMISVIYNAKCDDSSLPCFEGLEKAAEFTTCPPVEFPPGNSDI